MKQGTKTSPGRLQKSFSIHYWIVFLETFRYHIRDGGGTPLSVSTIGSYFLKPADRFLLKAHDESFSIHYWIVFLETPNTAWSGLFYSTFSIHYWIVFLETTKSSFFAIYPKTFSIHYWIVFLETICQPTKEPAFCKLSVSTIGSYFLKRIPDLGSLHVLIPFSIHYWIVFLETVGNRDADNPAPFFQYPLLDRISWNLDIISNVPTFVSLSVSTIGSYFLKQTCSVACLLLVVSFSIHYWIVFLETICQARRSSSWRFFQYPLLDRISWNDNARTLYAHRCLTFSIHYWIVFLETLVSDLDEQHKHLLSVSTIGSYFLKQRLTVAQVPTYHTFSIHYWIVFLETNWYIFCSTGIDIFQYPLLDRISWNYQMKVI